MFANDARLLAYIWAMSLKLRDLRALPSSEIEARYDTAAANTYVGIEYWHDELERRSRERVIQSNLRFTRASFWLTIASVLASFLALGVSVTTLILTL